MRLLYPLARRFIAGYDFDSAKDSINNLIKDGYEVSVDYAGEHSKTMRDCRKAFKAYLKIINNYRNIDVSIKPTQLGMLIHPLVSKLIISRIAQRAQIRDNTIRLDMEDSRVTALTLNLAMSLNDIYGNVGVAVQANLFRTEEDLKFLVDKGVSVRLVKGAYKEGKEIAHQESYTISAAFFNHAANLYANKANKPAIATHDEELLEDIQELMPDPNYFDYEFLYGVRRDLQKKMKDKGHRVRIYIPFGSDWFPYTLRRLKEWKNLKFIAINIFLELTNSIKKIIIKNK